jgi:hypothetical protein
MRAIARLPMAALACLLAGAGTARGADPEPPVAAAKPATTPAQAPSDATRSPAEKSGELRLGTTQITGNRELPKVMVIVPWKAADPAPLAGRPVNSLVEEALTPIDRDVMRRTLDYYKLLAATPAPEAGVEQAAGTDTTDQ